MLDPEHKKEYGVYHWDTFDNETLFIGDFNTMPMAEAFVITRYGKRLSTKGADMVEIVDSSGNVVYKSGVC